MTAALAAYNLAMYFTIVILNEVKDLILPQSAFADSSLKEGAIEDSLLTFRMTNGLQFIKQPLRVGNADPPPLAQGRLKIG